MSEVKINAMRLVIAKHVLEEIVKRGSFFWMLIEGRDDLRQRLIESVCGIVEAWTPPTLDNLTDEIISTWIDQNKMKCLVALYQEFGAKENEAAFAARLWA